MPHLDSITISPRDLKLVMDEIERNSGSYSHVKIIDNGKYFMIRDASDFKIGQVQKSATPNKTIKH